MRSLPFLPALLLAGCVPESGGSLAVEVGGPDYAVVGGYGVEWDGDAGWTRSVTCELTAEDEPEYRVEAYDRGEGELEFAAVIQAYDGPGEYERDPFQPAPAAVFEWTDEANTRWRLGTDSGGDCSFEVDETSRSGTVACRGVTVFAGTVQAAEPATLQATWSCGALDGDRLGLLRL